MPKFIKTKNLRIEDIPLSSADISLINTFALTFDVHEIKVFKELNTTNDFSKLTLIDLREVLFSEQRRWNHFGRPYDLDVEKRVRECVQEIRDRVSKGENSDTKNTEINNLFKKGILKVEDKDKTKEKINWMYFGLVFIIGILQLISLKYSLFNLISFSKEARFETGVPFLLLLIILPLFFLPFIKKEYRSYLYLNGVISVFGLLFLLFIIIGVIIG